MAALKKITFTLRDIRLISYHRQNVQLLTKVYAHSSITVQNSSILTSIGCQHQNGLLTSINLFHRGQSNIHTSIKNFIESKPTSKTSTEGSTDEELPKKLPLFQRFKAMYRDYWYVLGPVHVVTSTLWFGGFYYAAKSGIDIVSFVEKLHLSEAIVDKIKNSGHSTTGYLAISYALYKIFTPLRYTVTLGGTTISINYLTKWGYIKPIPKKEELQQMIIDKRHSLREKRLAFKDKMIGKLKTQKKRWKKKR